MAHSETRFSFHFDPKRVPHWKLILRKNPIVFRVDTASDEKDRRVNTTTEKKLFNIVIHHSYC